MPWNNLSSEPIWRFDGSAKSQRTGNNCFVRFLSTIFNYKYPLKCNKIGATSHALQQKYSDLQKNNTSSVFNNYYLHLSIMTVIPPTLHCARLNMTKLWIINKFIFWQGNQHIEAKLGIWSLRSYIKEQSARILHNIFDALQEEDRLSSINEPMIICQSNIHHWPWKNLLANHDRTVHYCVHSKDGWLHQ